MKKLISIVLMGVASFANAQSLPKIDDITDVPMGQVRAVQSNGEIIYVSENGRYAIQGKLTDAWQRKQLHTLDDIKQSAAKMPVKEMGIKVDTLNTISVGSGPREVIVFVDPRCGSCKALIKEAPKHPEYTVKLVVVPALGAESNVQSKALYCASDKQNALSHLLDGTLSSLQQKSDCDTARYDMTLTIATLFQIKGVPFVIAPDGRFKMGSKDTWTWLSQPSLAMNQTDN